VAYTPPVGNAVNFNFTDIPYVVPPARSIIFNFGAIPGPPFVDVQLPTGLRQHFTVEEEWFPEARRRFAPPSDSIIAKPMKALFQLDDDIGTDFWMLPKRRILVTPLFPGKRPVLFTVT
jgi:hypothetical protein